MIWAIKDNQRIRAEPNITAICDVCGKEVISKCGEIKVWHFAHKVSADCDSWSEEETEWHKNWKNEFPKESQEVKVGCHRADVKHNGWVIEFQHSPISSEEIQERENYYQNMIWVLDGKSFGRGLHLREKVRCLDGSNLLRKLPIQRLYEKQIVTFRWKSPPKCWWEAQKPLYVHLLGKIGHCQLGGNWLLKIEQIYRKCPCGGWGIIISKEEFLKRFKDGYNKN